ncbi:MAG: hydantoinase/oxoprolinase family protein [Pirellulales bacterium]
MNWLAIDIGGANLKVADGLGYAASYPFPLWKFPERLAQQLGHAIAEAPRAERLAITMTGELADCYASRREGVEKILDAVEEAAAGRSIVVYLVTGEMVAPQAARRNPLLAAASNWHALAAFAGRFVPHQTALLIDAGSTTCDVIPLVDGRPAARGRTDTERLLHQELVYTGVERSPVCALVSHLPYGQQNCAVAQELFATARDAYLLLGELPEQPADRNTADGRPATRDAARTRLARMVCADVDEFTWEDARRAAVAIQAAQVERLGAAVRWVAAALPQPPSSVVLVGQGEFLIRAALDTLPWKGVTVSLEQLAGDLVSRCGPAHALAVLSREVPDR